MESYERAAKAYIDSDSDITLSADAESIDGQSVIVMRVFQPASALTLVLTPEDARQLKGALDRALKGVRE